MTEIETERIHLGRWEARYAAPHDRVAVSVNDVAVPSTLVAIARTRRGARRRLIRYIDEQAGIR